MLRLAVAALCLLCPLVIWTLLVGGLLPTPPASVEIYDAPANYIFRDTTELPTRSFAINPTERTLVFIQMGQSLRTTQLPSFYAPVNHRKMAALNIYDGVPYSIRGPLPGTDYYGSLGGNGPGNLTVRVADLLITNGKFDRVIIVPLAVGGTAAADWAEGGPYCGRFAVAMARLSAHGIVPGRKGVTFLVEWGQGEADNQLGTSRESYAASLKSVISSARSAGFDGKFFVAIESFENGVIAKPVAAAQASVVDGETVLQSGNLDTLTGRENRLHFGLSSHLTNAGGAAAAALIYEAIASHY